MKNAKWFFALAASALLASCSSGSPVSSSSASSGLEASSSESALSSSESEESGSSSAFDPTDISSITERRTPLYELDLNSATGEFYFQRTNSYEVYFINDSSIPYVDVAYYLGTMISTGNTKTGRRDYTCEGDGDFLTISNPVNDSHLDLDFASRQAAYYGFDGFFNRYEDTAKPFADMFLGASYLLDDLATYDYTQITETYDIDLTAYNMKMYRYGEHYYLPYATLANLIGDSSYGSYIYTDDGFYDYSTGSDSGTMEVMAALREFGTDWADEEYLQHSYDSFALFLDTFYGLDEKNFLHNGENFHFLDGGAYAALEPYKERLLSKESDVSNTAMLEFFQKELDDGGHTYFDGSNIFSTKTYNWSDYAGEEYVYGTDIGYAIGDARKAKGNDPYSKNPDAASPAGYYEKKDNVAYIQFDAFTMEKEDYDASEITAENYWLDTITLIHYANQQIQGDSSITDVVIDLANNGGGVVYTSEFVASWLCGGNHGILRNAKTRNTMEYNVYADVDLDGSFTSFDYLPSDINVYIMVSAASFSCGNKLPCNVQDNRKENTYFIGSRSGGGSCVVSSSPINFLGAKCQISSNLQVGRLGSTPEDFITDEGGVTADFYHIDDDDPETFADIDAIVAKINEKN